VQGSGDQTQYDMAVSGSRSVTSIRGEVETEALHSHNLTATIMSGIAEQQPLLAYPYGEDAALLERPKRSIKVWRENISRVLESRRFHTFVITLVSYRFCYIFSLPFDMLCCCRS